MAEDIKMNKWKKFINFLNSKVGEEVTRKELRIETGCSALTVDTYRLTLEHSGFIDHTGTGKYKVKKIIPFASCGLYRKFIKFEYEDLEKLISEEKDTKSKRSSNVWKRIVNFLNFNINNIVTVDKILEVMSCKSATSEMYLKLLHNSGYLSYRKPQSYLVAKQIPEFISFLELKEFFMPAIFQKSTTWFKFLGDTGYGHESSLENYSNMKKELIEQNSKGDKTHV